MLRRLSYGQPRGCCLAPRHGDDDDAEDATSLALKAWPPTAARATAMRHALRSLHARLVMERDCARCTPRRSSTGSRRRASRKTPFSFAVIRCVVGGGGGCAVVVVVGVVVVVVVVAGVVEVAVAAAGA